MRDRKLVVNEAEANVVRYLFRRFAQVRSLVQVVRDASAKGHHTKSWTTAKGRRREGRPFDMATLRKVLTNRVYLGDAMHKGTAYPGEHQPIITQAAWDKAQAILTENPRKRANTARAQTPALLKGLIFVKATGRAMVPSFTRRRGRQYRYYVSMDALKRGAESCPVRRVPAGQVEAVVLAEVRALLRAPEVVAQTWLAARDEDEKIPANAVREALVEFESLWDQLFPVEQARIVGLVVERVEIAPDGIEIRLNLAGLTSIIDQVRGGASAAMQAA